MLRLLLVAICAGVGVSRSKHKRAHQLSGISQGHVTAAKGLVKEGRLVEALGSFEQAIETQHPQSWAPDGFNERRNPHFMKGLVLQELQRHPEAVAALQGAVDAMPPGFPEPHASLCATLFAHFQRQLAARQSAQTVADDTFLVERVVGHCDNAIAATPPTGMRWEGTLKKALAHAHRTKAQILSSLGRMGEARLSSASALRLAPIHRPLATELEAARATTVIAAHGTLHKLWPIRTVAEEHGPNGPDPFALVSTVPGSVPAQKPWYLPMYVSQIDPSLALSSMNDGLVAVVAQLRAQDPVGATVSNAGGWQSHTGHTQYYEGAEAGSFLHTKLVSHSEKLRLAGFLCLKLNVRGAHDCYVYSGQGGEHGTSAVSQLRAHILRQVNDMLTLMRIVPQSGVASGGSVPHVSIMQSWANVNNKNHSNVMHNHGTATFSGCYYVQSGYTEGDHSDNVKQNATALVFAHPWKQSSEEWSDSALGRSGTLALWPGHLGHRVPPHLGNLQRISIAFNVPTPYKLV
jgi:tetratricopeptide (TPR) repeat protein